MALIAGVGLVAGCGQKPVAVVNGEALSEAEFLRLCETATQIAPQRGTVGLQVLAGWVRSTLMAQEARKQGLYPTDQELDERLESFRRQAEFMGMNMEEQIREQGATMESFRRDLLDTMIQDNLMLNGIEVTDEELNQEFDRRKREFTIPEQVTISQITVDSKKDLDQAQADLASNASFDLVAQTLSKDPFANQGGRVPYPLTADAPPGGPVAQEVISAAFKLKEGQVSDPVQVGATWVVVRLEEKQEAKEPSLDDVRELLRASLRQEKASRSPQLPKNQQAVAQAVQQAQIEINRPEYMVIKDQMQGAAASFNTQAAGGGALPPGAP